MADTVVARVIQEQADQLTLRLNCISDATGEAAVIKLSKAGLKGPDGVNPPSQLEIKSIRWNVQGFTNVRLLWDHTTDDVAYVMSGNSADAPMSMKDPLSAGGTGDLLLTSIGAAAGATYDVTVVVGKRL